MSAVTLGSFCWPFARFPRNGFVCMIPTRTLRSRIATMKVELGPKRTHFLTCAFEDFRLTCMGCSCNTCKRAVARLDSILPQRSFVPRSCGPMRDSTDPMCFCVTGSSDDMPYRHVQWTYRVASARSGLLSCSWELHAACKCCRQKS